MNVRIVKSQEEMGKIHSYHDTWLPALNIFYMKFSADLWPDLDIGQRSENVQIPISPLIFEEIFTRLIPEDLYTKPHNLVWDKRFDLFSLGHVTLNFSVRSL